MDYTYYIHYVDKERAAMLNEVLMGIVTRLSRNKQGVFEHNGQLSTKAVNSLKQQHKASAVYPTAALMNHSCLPNASLVFGQHCQLELRALRPILAGQEICNCYGARFGMSVLIFYICSFISG